MYRQHPDHDLFFISSTEQPADPDHFQMNEREDGPSSIIPDSQHWVRHYSSFSDADQDLNGSVDADLDVTRQLG